MNSGLTKRGKGLASDEWETPPWLFKALDAEFGLDTDAAARVEPITIDRGDDKPPLVLTRPNPLCPEWTNDISLFARQGHLNGRRVFCNPPYSNIGLFVEAALSGVSDIWVMVLPAFVDKAWYRRLFESGRVEWRPFVKRIRFYENGKPGGSPFFGTTLAIVRPR